MKKIYAEPQLEVVSVSEADIITLSESSLSFSVFDEVFGGGN